MRGIFMRVEGSPETAFGTLAIRTTEHVPLSRAERESVPRPILRGGVELSRRRIPPSPQ